VRRHRRPPQPIRSLAVLLGIGAALTPLFYADSGGSTLSFVLFIILFGGWAFLPWGLVASEFVRLSVLSRAASMAAFVAISVFVYAGADESSTGAIGILFLPAYLLMVLGVVVLIDAVTRRLGRRS